MSDKQTNPSEKPSKKVHIETWGCQMNVADSEKMLSLLKDDNYTLTDNADDADLIVLNTCHIREKARHKVVSRIGQLRELKNENPSLTIAMTGCVAQAEGKKLLKEVPAIDVMIGPGKIDDLPKLVKSHKESGNRDLSIGFSERGKHDDHDHSHDHNDHVISDEPIIGIAHPTATGKNEVSRYVNIQQGCDNFCTFCVVPFTRGREISETPDQIVANVKAMVDNGAKEVTLLGQNVNSYGQDLVESGKLAVTTNGPFVDLLERVVTEVPNLMRLRFTTSNPHDFTKPLAEIFKKYPKLGSYIHLPVQSGSDTILNTMKRKVTAETYRERIQWLKEAIPDIAISTDIIVGFPGETEEDFMATYNLVKEVRYSFIFAFKYSARKNTAAARFKDQIPDDVMSDRLKRLNDLQDSITVELNEQEIGKTRDVLFLYESKKNPNVYYGRTPHFRLVRVEAQRDLTGKILPVLIEKANKTALQGVLV